MTTTSLLRVERIKLFNRKLYWIELAVVIGLTVLVLGILGAVVSSPGWDEEIAKSSSEDAAQAAQVKEGLFWPKGMQMAAQMTAGAGLGGILMIVLAGAFVAQEYSWGTLAAMIAQGVPRHAALVAKIVQLLGAALLMCFGAVAAAGTASAAITLILNGSVPIQGQDFIDGLLIAAASFLTLLPYIGLAFWLAVATRSTVAAIGVGIGVMVMEGPIAQLAMLLGDLATKIASYLPGMLSAQLLGGGDASATALAVPAAGLILWGLFFFGLSVWSFSKQDLTV
jgi:ABC-type transport system involved in multi-copper enzyme maturation permease subunit